MEMEKSQSIQALRLPRRCTELWCTLMLYVVLPAWKYHLQADRIHASSNVKRTISSVHGNDANFVSDTKFVSRHDCKSDIISFRRKFKRSNSKTVALSFHTRRGGCPGTTAKIGFDSRWCSDSGFWAGISFESAFCYFAYSQKSR